MESNIFKKINEEFYNSLNNNLFGLPKNIKLLKEKVEKQATNKYIKTIYKIDEYTHIQFFYITNIDIEQDCGVVAYGDSITLVKDLNKTVISICFDKNESYILTSDYAGTDPGDSFEEITKEEYYNALEEMKNFIQNVK